MKCIAYDIHTITSSAPNYVKYQHDSKYSMIKPFSM